MCLNKQLILMGIFLFCAADVQAWQHEIMIGYGSGTEVEQSYRNQGIVITGKLYKFNKVDDTLYASIDGTLATIESSYTNNNHLTTAALALAMRAFFANPELHTIRPYLQASFGPAYLSSTTLGNRVQGSHYAFQTTLEAGTEWGGQQHSWDINLKAMHYCNAGIFHPNQGINLIPVLSIGYQF